MTTTGVSLSLIPDYGGSLPKQYRSSSVGEIKDLAIKKLFRMILVGPSFSGKNNLVFHILKHSPNVFSHLHIIARNPDQELYLYLRDELKGFVTFWDQDEVPRVDSIRKSKAMDGIELVIIDDFSNDAALQKNVFSHYFTRGRHFRLSTIFLTQSYFQGTSKLIRSNAEYCAILKANSRRDLALVLKDFNIDISEDGFYEAYKRATRSKGQMLFIDSVNSHIRSNFDMIFDNKTLELSRINKSVQKM